MLAAVHAREADCRSHAVGEEFRKGAGIFVSYDAGDRPRGGRVLRRKGCTAVEKSSAAIALVGSLTAQGILERLNGDQAVQSRFAGEKSSFAPMLVVRWITEQIKSSAGACKAGDAEFRKCLVVADGRWILGQRRTVFTVSHE